MKHSVTSRFFAMILVLSMLFLTACTGIQPAVEAPAVNNGIINDKGQGNVQNISSTNAPKGEYNEGVVLVKNDKPLTDNMLAQLDFVSAEPLYAGSDWYRVKLGSSMETEETVDYLHKLDCFDDVDYDYVMKADLDVPNVSCNPDHDKEKHHGTHKIPEGWEHMAGNDVNPGGSSDVVVAVIDTGVDYNHLDLRNNIWVNIGEIPDNGKDDDGNGYIDDIYGWDCVGDDKDPMDDNGHGTHVAGIIAAENNDIGGVGIAYNCKIMVLKAGNSSGYFNNSDIAEAIQYAYMNGASVINMSFGGSFISIAVEEALENAYNSCVLVAAAGNESLCNNVDCETCDFVGVSYPAALPYVIGVMSTNHDGSCVSAFSNYDHYPYDSVEYEVYAVGEAVPSTWPGNKYATLNGTSMAAPTVSAIAALLRSAFADREMYSTKYIQSQIVNTGTVNPFNMMLMETDECHTVADAYEALTYIPKPDVKLYDYYIDDSTLISEVNNGNGVMDAGETVHLFVSLMNRGGVASNVQVSIDTMRNNDPGLTDPYFTFTNPNQSFSDIGTYSVREAYEDQYFEIVISPDCPNDYLVNFNIRFTYTNGLDDNDTTVYQDDGRQKAQYNVSSGYHLPQVITESVRYKADKLYIVSQTTTIPQGVMVVFEEGCRIEFQADLSGESTDPVIKVYGDLQFVGTKDNMIEIYASSTTSRGLISNQGSTYFECVNAVNVSISDVWMTNSIYICNSTLISEHSLVNYEFDVMDNCYVRFHGEDAPNKLLDVNYIKNSYLAVPANCDISAEKAENNIFMSMPRSYKYSSVGEISLNGGVYNGYFSNNAFLNLCDDKGEMHKLSVSTYGWVDDNYFSDSYRKYAEDKISGYITSTGIPKVDVFASCSDISKLWPHVVSVEMFNKDGEPITRVGKEEIKVRVTFNRPMDMNQDTFVTFGTIEPYADYKIEGEYISETVWEGTYTLKAQIENGQNFLKVNNACAADDPTKEVFGEYHLHEFTIDTTAAMSMNLQAVATGNGIELTWIQDDYDTLMGYNVYRSTEKDGNYVKLNAAVLPSTEAFFVDDNAEPGVTYWYTFTVVLSDFSESAPAGKVSCTARDTINPNLYHTPVNQGYQNNNLVISCTASDNITIASVTLYYRTAGAAQWKSLTMSRQNDKYSATIFGSELSMDGLEYYLVAVDADGNSVSKGSADAPYTVVIKDASSISRLGDVDGDGAITTKDALMIMQAINDELILTDDQFKRADLNCDGVLSSVEALRILQYINGKVTTLTM